MLFAMQIGPHKFAWFRLPRCRISTAVADCHNSTFARIAPSSICMTVQACCPSA
jgi:hypothetical protein